MITKEDLRIKDSNFYELPEFKEEPISHVLTDEDVFDPARVTFIYDYPFDLWPVILKYNGIVDPMNDLTPGLTILIPSKQDLKDKELAK